MPAPSFVYEYPIDLVTSFNANYYVTLQNNIVSYVSQFLPLIGAQMLGTILWDPGQTFPSGQVIIPNPTSYAHNGFYVTLSDHINDPIHGASVAPLAHAASHAIGGGDPLYGTTLAISSSAATTSIKSYVDTKVAAATAVSYPGPSPSSRWEIGGADPVYGNLIAVDSAHPTLDLRTYVSQSVSAAIASGGSTNPTYSNITISSGVINTTSNLILESKGVSIVASTGTNTNLTAPLSTGVVTVGYAGTPTAFGSFNTAGYSIGTSVYGPNGMVSNGNITASGDIQASRTASGNAGAGVLFLGANTSAYLSYSSDVLASFYFSKQVNMSDNLTIANGKGLVIPTTFNLGSVANNAGNPGIKSLGTDLNLYAKDAGNIRLGADNASLSAVTFGPANTWASMNATGLHMGSTVISASGAAVAGALSLNGAYINLAGDLGVANTSTSGTIYFGRTNANLIDCGNTLANGFTFTTAGVVRSQIKNDGTYLAGSSSYGPAGATISGVLASAKVVSASIGLDTTGNSGFAFGTNYTTGMFSASAGDLRFLVGGTSNLVMSSILTTVNTSFTTTGALSAVSGAISGALSVNGLLSLNAGIQTVSTTITKFRVKFGVGLGTTAGAVSTSTVYPIVPVLTYSSGQVEGIRITAATADTGSASTFTIYKNAVVIGTIAFGAGQTTAFALPTPNPSPIVAGDTLHTVCTQAGGATGVSVYAECSQLVY